MLITNNITKLTKILAKYQRLDSNVIIHYYNSNNNLQSFCTLVLLKIIFMNNNLNYNVIISNIKCNLLKRTSLFTKNSKKVHIHIFTVIERMSLQYVIESLNQLNIFIFDIVCDKIVLSNYAQNLILISNFIKYDRKQQKNIKGNETIFPLSISLFRHLNFYLYLVKPFIWLMLVTLKEHCMSINLNDSIFKRWSGIIIAYTLKHNRVLNTKFITSPLMIYSNIKYKSIGLNLQLLNFWNIIESIHFSTQAFYFLKLWDNCTNKIYKLFRKLNISRLGNIKNWQLLKRPYKIYFYKKIKSILNSSTIEFILVLEKNKLVLGLNDYYSIMKYGITLNLNLYKVEANNINTILHFLNTTFLMYGIIVFKNYLKKIHIFLAATKNEKNHKYFRTILKNNVLLISLINTNSSFFINAYKIHNEIFERFNCILYYLDITPINFMLIIKMSPVYHRLNYLILNTTLFNKEIVFLSYTIFSKNFINYKNSIINIRFENLRKFNIFVLVFLVLFKLLILNTELI